MSLDVEYQCAAGFGLAFREFVLWAEGENHGGGHVRSDNLTLTYSSP